MPRARAIPLSWSMSMWRPWLRETGNWLRAISCGSALLALSPAAAEGVPKLVRDRSPRLEASDCPAALRDRFQCGTLIVPERWDLARGRMIRLPFAVRSSATRRSRDAFTFLNGGPGLSALRAAQNIVAAFPDWHEDQVFLDRRGLGLAEPAFVCPAGVRRGAGRWDIEGALKCRDRWRAAGYDLDAYDSAAAASDLDALRRLLGYERWNLLGVSYGTAYALSVMRDFPNSVRSAVLDSPYPFNQDPFYANVASHLVTIDKIIAACSANGDCRVRYPDLQRRLIGAVRRAQSVPLTSTEGPVDGRGILYRLVHAAESAGSLPVIPQMIDAAARGDGDAFVKLDAFVDPSTVSLEGFPTEARAAGLWPMIECRERFPRHRGRVAPTPGWPVWFARLVDVEWGPGEVDLCRRWGARPAPTAINRRIETAIPTLILVGAYDPETPPQWALRTAAMLPNGSATSLVIPNTSHVAILSACGLGLAKQFLSDWASPLDRTCTTALTPLTFPPPRVGGVRASAGSAHP